MAGVIIRAVYAPDDDAQADALNLLLTGTTEAGPSNGPASVISGDLRQKSNFATKRNDDDGPRTR